MDTRTVILKQNSTKQQKISTFSSRQLTQIIMLSLKQ